MICFLYDSFMLHTTKVQCCFLLAKISHRNSISTALSRVAMVGYSESWVRVPFVSSITLKLQKLIEDLRNSQPAGIVLIMLSSKPWCSLAKSKFSVMQPKLFTWNNKLLCSWEPLIKQKFMPLKIMSWFIEKQQLFTSIFLNEIWTCCLIVMGIRSLGTIVFRYFWSTTLLHV